MKEGVPVPENLPVEHPEAEPKVEQMADFVSREPEALAAAAAERADKGGNDPALWQRIRRKVRQDVLATALAVTTVAGAWGLMPAPAEAGQRGRKAAEIGAVVLGAASDLLEESYHRSVDRIRNLEEAWEQNQQEQDRLVRYYEQVARRIERTNQQIAAEEPNGDTSGLREQLEYRERLRGEQDHIRRQLRREVAFQHALEDRMGARVQDMQRGGTKKRDVGRVLGAGSQVLDIISRGY